MDAGPGHRKTARALSERLELLGHDGLVDSGVAVAAGWGGIVEVGGNYVARLVVVVAAEEVVEAEADVRNDARVVEIAVFCPAPVVEVSR